MQPLALGQMSGAMKVLAVHEMDELGMFLEITPSKINQSGHRLGRLEPFQIERRFGPANSRIGRFQHRHEERFFVSEIVVEQGLVHASTPRDLVDPRASKT